MKMVGVGDQNARHFMYDASGTTTGSTQLIVPEQRFGRSFFLFENISATDMYLEIGGARATATLTNGVVSSIAITNGGFGFNLPPSVKFYGGGDPNNHSAFTPGLPGYPSPQGTVGNTVKSHSAKAHAVLTGGVLTSIVIDDGGAGYVKAPYVFLENHLADPYGCADPFYGSVNSGILLKAGGGSFTNAGVACTTDAISLYCSAGSAAYSFKFML